MHPTIESLKRGIDKYQHRLAGLADDVGRSKAVIEQEIGASKTHKLGVIDAVYMAKIMCEAGEAHCHDFASHVAEECGGKFVLLDGREETDASPVEKISHLMRETSDVTTTVLDSMSDNVISNNELMVIEKEIAQLEDVLRKLRAAARVVNAAGKPGGARDFISLAIRGSTGVSA